MDPRADWDPQDLFDLYLYDHLIRSNKHKTAEIFREEAKLHVDESVIESDRGFLNEWWSFFSDVYSSRPVKENDLKVDDSIMAEQITDTQLQIVSPLVPQLENWRNPGKLPMYTDFDKMVEQPTACLLTAKLNERKQLMDLFKEFNPNLRLQDVNKATISCHLQQLYSQQSQRRLVRERGINLQKNITMNRTLNGVPEALTTRIGSYNPGLNRGVPSLPLAGWPLSGSQQIPLSLRNQLRNPLLRVPSQQHQFQLSTTEHAQECLAQFLSNAQANAIARSTILESSGHLNTCKPSCSSNVIKNALTILQSNQVDELRQQDQLQQQLQENDRKRKLQSYSGAGENALNCEEAADKHKFENAGAFSTQKKNQAGNSSTAITFSKQQSGDWKTDIKGFTFEEIGCLQSSKSRVLCCHFSSDGKLLASAGDDKKVLILNMDTFDVFDTLEGHSQLISDVRFRPNSTVFATSSFDKTVQIWDAGRPRKPTRKLIGHAEEVNSIDFHPRKVNLLCSCDSLGEIRLWNVNQEVCTRVSKGATKQVRFEPRAGKLLAAASGNRISIIDVETDTTQFCLEGHKEEVRSICWDTSGKYIASVSEDSARVWSATGGKCIHELKCNGYNFQSCTFHPAYLQLLVIGGYQSIGLWNPTEGRKVMKASAHHGIIAALSDSPQTEIIASASHDKCVKLWKLDACLKI